MQVLGSTETSGPGVRSHQDNAAPRGRGATFFDALSAFNCAPWLSGIGCRLDITPRRFILGFMHELGIATAALEQALAQARLAGAQQVLRIGLRVGVLAGVNADALQFAFEALLPGTAADGAVIEIESVAAVAHCAECGRDFTAEADDLCTCPLCAQPSADFKQGRELELSRLEVI